MINLEKQKERFKNHVAKLTDYGNIKILDFKAPNTGEYRIRFLFEEDYYRLHISGDLGELTASNYSNMTYEEFSDFVDDVGYFEGKIDCMSRDIYFYDDDKAREDLLELISECGLQYELTKDKVDCESDKDIIDEYIDDVLIYFDGNRGIDSHGYDKLSKYIDDVWELIGDIGKKETGILDLYMLAFKLAKQNLLESEVEG